MRDEDKLVFGTTEHRVDGTPNIGRMYATSSVSLGIVPDTPYEVNFQSPNDVISITFGATDCMIAAGTSKRSHSITTPGELRWMPAGIDVYTHAPEKVAELVHIDVSPHIRAEMLTSLANAETANIEDYATLFGSPEIPAIAHLVRRFIISGGAGGKIVAESLGIMALHQALSALIAKGPRDRTIGLSGNRLRDTIDFIEDHLNQNIGLTDLAAQACLSTFHFTRSFKMATGITPHQYLLERRIARARDMLSKSNDSIAEIAYDVGFSSQSHMTEAFRKSLGITPARYRKETGE